MASTQIKQFIKNSFYGGISQGSVAGYEGSYQDGLGLDYRTDPYKLTALKKLKKDSGSTVTDLVKWMIENQGDIWMYGDTGKIYKRASNGTYTNPKTVSNSNGQGMAIFNNELWYANNKSIGKATDIESTATFIDNYFISEDHEVHESNEANGQTYSVPTSISETATNKYSFTASTDNVTGIFLNIQAKGSGTLTITIHDNSDNVVASVTKEASDLVTGLNRINFTGSNEITDSSAYHVHVTSSASGYTVQTGTSGDLETATIYLTHFYGGDIDQSNNITIREDIDEHSYTLETTLKEGATHRQTFTPAKQTLAAVSLYVLDKSTANITVVVHDSLDKEVATATLTNASIPHKRGICKFKFSTPPKLIEGAEYHIHVYGTAGATIVSDTASDLEGAGFYTHFQVLEEDSDFHTMKTFLNKLCIGNGHFLATIDDSEVYNNQALTFPEGEKVRALETVGDMIVIATWRGNDLGEYSESRLYLWDGLSPTFNGFVSISGQVNALKNDGTNRLLIIHGTKGLISAYTGRISALRQIKDVSENKTVEVYPAAFGTWEGITYFGISDGTDTGAERVVYAFGRNDQDYPITLSKDYPISTGSKDGDVRIGAILGIAADKFFVSWRDDTSYGVDVIDTENDQQEVTMTDLRFNGKQPNIQKSVKTVSIRFNPLTTGQEIKVYYRINNKGSFVLLGKASHLNDGADKTYKSFPFDENLFEVEFRIVLKTTGASSPTLLTLAMFYEYKQEYQLETQ